MKIKILLASACMMLASTTYVDAKSQKRTIFRKQEMLLLELMLYRS